MKIRNFRGDLTNVSTINKNHCLQRRPVHRYGNHKHPEALQLSSRQIHIIYNYCWHMHGLFGRVICSEVFFKIKLFFFWIL